MSDVATLTASFATAIAVALGLWAYIGTLREQTYLEYTGRYHDLQKDLAKASLEHDADPKLKAWDQALACVYLDLCSEEVKLCLRRRIARRVWRDWSDGIRAGILQPVIQEAWNSQRSVHEYRVLRAFLVLGLREARREYRIPGSVDLDLDPT